MEMRTISMMVGKGSVSHNSRDFHAKNIDPERTKNNHCYCNYNIKQIYKMMFDDAVKRYNDKQKRNDRKIDNYYEKIRSGKQEKLFHEVIMQIGNWTDSSAKNDDGKMMAVLLNEYMLSFQERNPYLKVFSAHLHMDEATPHLHIDFVPFTDKSTRGLDTRVSLKQALALQGFKGGSRQETEWNQWVQSEKKSLAKIMEAHDIGWDKKGTHEKHLSVLDYEKKMRTEEISELESKVDDLRDDIDNTKEKFNITKSELHELETKEKLIGQNIDKYEKDPEWQLPESSPMMTSKSYRNKIVVPFVAKLKEVIRSLVAQCLKHMRTVEDLNRKLSKMQESINSYEDSYNRLLLENQSLKNVVWQYNMVKKVIGVDLIQDIIKKNCEQSKKIGRTSIKSSSRETR